MLFIQLYTTISTLVPLPLFTSKRGRGCHHPRVSS
jgi:hypothetical protein